MRDILPVSRRHPDFDLTSGRLLKWNALWNLLGTAAPIPVALLCLPALVHKLGKDQFGVLALAWTLIGYAGLFDFGLGRALTKLVSEKLGGKEEDEIPGLFWTSQFLMSLMALAGTILLVLIAPWLVHSALKIPAALQTATLHSFYALALSMPVVISTAGLRGFLEAKQEFGLINALRVPMGVFTFAGPLAVLPFTTSIVPIVCTLVAGRIVAWLAHLLFCLRVLPALSERMEITRAAIMPLFRLGGWMTVSNIVGPLMLYMDRFVIGGLISAAAVAYYATPYEVVTKLLIISGAISAVMFPAFGASFARDLSRTVDLYRRGMKCTVAIMLPLILLLALIAKEGLTLWLGPEFADHSLHVAEFLLVGTLAFGIETLPFALIQGAGRPDIPAKLNLIEIPFYAAALYWFIERYGVTGAAAAWALRAVVDALLLLVFAQRLLRVPACADPEKSLCPLPLNSNPG